MSLPPDALYLFALKWFLFIGFVLLVAQLLVAKVVSFWHEIRRLIGLIRTKVNKAGDKLTVRGGLIQYRKARRIRP
jgi:hypothetical protein